MKIFVAQDRYGNLYVTDERTCLPEDVVDFHECWLPRHSRYTSEDPTLTIEVSDYNEIISIIRDDE